MLECFEEYRSCVRQICVSDLKGFGPLCVEGPFHFLPNATLLFCGSWFSNCKSCWNVLANLNCTLTVLIPGTMYENYLNARLWAKHTNFRSDQVRATQVEDNTARDARETSKKPKNQILITNIITGCCSLVSACSYCQLNCYSNG